MSTKTKCNFASLDKSVIVSNELTVGVDRKVSGQTDMFMLGVTASTTHLLTPWHSPNWFDFMQGIYWVTIFAMPVIPMNL